MTGFDTVYAASTLLPEWFEKARPGQQVIYARGPSLNQREPAVQLVNQWHAAGQVKLHVKRIEGSLCYVAVRCEEARDQGKVGKVARGQPADARELALLDYIRGLCADGLPMPTNGAIAEELGWAGKEQVQYRLNRLINGGFVTVRVPDAAKLPHLRVVTVRASGLSTAGSTDRSRERARA